MEKNRQESSRIRRESEGEAELEGEVEGKRKKGKCRVSINGRMDNWMTEVDFKEFSSLTQVRDFRVRVLILGKA